LLDLDITTRGVIRECSWIVLVLDNDDGCVAADLRMQGTEDVLGSSCACSLPYSRWQSGERPAQHAFPSGHTNRFLSAEAGHRTVPMNPSASVRPWRSSESSFSEAMMLSTYVPAR
jgi:hypothetical protein